MTSTLVAPTIPGRLIALRVVAVAYALFTAIASFGLPSLFLSWSTTGDELPLRTGYIIWGVLAGIVIPGLALAAVRRRAGAELRALAMLACAALLVLVVGFNTLHLAYIAAVVLPALMLLALHPSTRGALAHRGGVQKAPAVVIAAMTVPAIWYAVDMATTSRTINVLDTPSGEYTVHGQYAQAAVLALALLLAGAVGAIRQAGQLVVVLVVALSAAIFGVAGIAFPGDLMGLGSTWGAATVAAAAVYAATVAFGRR